MSHSEQSVTIVCDGRDRFFGVAEQLARDCKCELWRLDDPASALGRPNVVGCQVQEGAPVGDVLWVSSQQASISATWRILSSRGARLGLITGETAEDAVALARRGRSLEKANGRGWICAPPDLIESIPRSLRELVDVVRPEELGQWIVKEAPFAIIAGHGREDVLYFEPVALCARAEEVTACDPSRCPYPQPKLSIRAINARVVALLGCSAGKLGNGLFPPSSRLGFALASRAAACLTTQHLFELDAPLLANMIAQLASGEKVGTVRAEAASWHNVRSGGAPDPFVLFGDPRVRAVSRSLVFPRPSMPVIDRGPASFPESLLTRLWELEVLELLPPSAVAMQTLLRRQHRAVRVGQQLNERLQANLRAILARLDQEIVEDLCFRSLGGYLWLVNQYRAFVSRVHTHGSCSSCGEDSHVVEASDPLSTIRRHREVCERCGIRSDWSSGHERVDILDAEVSCDRLRLRIKVPSSASVLGVTLNAGAAFVKTTVDLESGMQLPAVVDGSSIRTVDLEVRDLPRGVHYAKAIVMQDLVLACASHPVAVFDA